jgi:peptidoglycan/LPS O-acetylase OafA/YrhL
MITGYRVLHSLNAARVCAEFLVVNYHISLTPTSFLKNDKHTQALMSFFFVLSGFMAMYTNAGRDFSARPAKMDYIHRRLSKTYPTYLFWTLLDLPGTIVKHIQFAGATNRHLEEQNERLHNTNSTLSAELARTRPASKPSSVHISPYLSKKIPKRK